MTYKKGNCHVPQSQTSSSSQLILLLNFLATPKIQFKTSADFQKYTFTQDGERACRPTTLLLQSCAYEMKCRPVSVSLKELGSQKPLLFLLPKACDCECQLRTHCEVVESSKVVTLMPVSLIFGLPYSFLIYQLIMLLHLLRLC